jgi:hypothetical protein
VYPDSLNPDPDPDPAFQLTPDPLDPDLDQDTIRIQGFDDQTQKLKKKIQLKMCFYFLFFLIKNAIYLSLGLHKGHPSYRRSLQPSKRTSSASKNVIY